MVTNKYDLVAIKKNDIYYVRDKGRYPADFADDAHLRFDVDRCESFDVRWLVFKALPTKAERCIVGMDTIARFELKDGFQATDRTPKSLSSTAFGCYDDYDECDNTEIRGLYDPVYEKTSDTWEHVDIAIEVVDADCEPLRNTKYTHHTDFPYYIECHDVVRHKYPCHIKAEDVFKYVCAAIKDNLTGHCYISSDSDSHIKVDVRIPVLHDEMHNVDVSNFNARKPKWKEVPLRDMQKTIINICTPRYAYGHVLNDVHADNYYELEENMDNIIQSYIDIMQTKPVVCEHCKGYGWYIG